MNFAVPFCEGDGSSLLKAVLSWAFKMCDTCEAEAVKRRLVRIFHMVNRSIWLDPS